MDVLGPDGLYFTANNTANMVINGSGANDTITVGAASQTVNANGGNDRIIASAANAGVLVNGGWGNNTLEITGGGTAVMNAKDTNVNTVQLDAATTIMLNNQEGLTVIGKAAGNTFIAGNGDETLIGGGADTYILNAKEDDVIKGTAANLNGATVQNLNWMDQIDVTTLAFGRNTKLNYHQDNNQSGTLTITDGTHTAALTLLGQYAGSFTAHSDFAGGTIITANMPPQNSQPLLAGSHA